MFWSIFSISIGATLGAVARWILGLCLNPLFPLLSIGTLFANWLGSFIMGLLLGCFSLWPVNPILRQGLITGFLGALTTFSTFSAEMGELFLQKRILWLFLGITLHVAGSIALFLLGINSIQLFKAFNK